VTLTTSAAIASSIDFGSVEAFSAGPDRRVPEDRNDLITLSPNVRPGVTVDNLTWSVAADSPATPIEVDDGVPATFAFRPIDNGVYIVQLTGQVASKSVSDRVVITVTDVGPTLVISGNNTADEGLAYTLNLHATDPGTDAVTRWEIDWDGDNQVDQTLPGNPSSVSHLYPDGPATVTIRAWATNEDGRFAANTLALTVRDVAPSLTLTLAESSDPDTTVSEGEQISLTLGSVIDLTSDTVTSYVIDWGDQTQAIYSAAELAQLGWTLTHVYAESSPRNAAGQSVPYRISVTLIDEDGIHAPRDSNRQRIPGGGELEVMVLNVAPTAQFQLAEIGTIDEGDSVRLQFSNVADISPSDLAAGMLYSFDFNGDPNRDGNFFNDPGDRVDSPEADASWAVPDAGSLTVRGRVRDRDGGMTEYTYSLNAANRSPMNVSAGGPYRTWEGNGMTLQASATIAAVDQEEVTWSWFVDRDRNGVFSTTELLGHGSILTLSWSQLQASGIDDGPATFTIGVRVDDGDASTPIEVTTTLDIENVPPLPQLTVLTPENERKEGTLLRFDDPPIDPSARDTVASYDWEMIYQGVVVATNQNDGIDDATQSTFDFQPTNDGQYEVRLTVRDQDGGEATTSQFFSVANVMPTLTGSLTVKSDPTTPQVVTISGTVLDPGSDTLRGTLALGDGTILPVVFQAQGDVWTFEQTHVYAAVSNYPISLLVSDGQSTAPVARANVSLIKGDTNNDGNVTALDALIIINFLNRFGPQPVGPNTPSPLLDVDGDGWIVALDVLRVINYLNQASAAEGESGSDAEGESAAGESESAPFLPLASSSQGILQLQANLAFSTGMTIPPSFERKRADAGVSWRLLPSDEEPFPPHPARHPSEPLLDLIATERAFMQHSHAAEPPRAMPLQRPKTDSSGSSGHSVNRAESDYEFQDWSELEQEPSRSSELERTIDQLLRVRHA